jgi:hypothetical protein
VFGIDLCFTFSQEAVPAALDEAGSEVQTPNKGFICRKARRQSFSES